MRADRAFKDSVKSAGLKWSAVEKVLPDWAGQAFDSASGVLELKGFLVRHLGLHLESDGSLTAAVLPTALFKTTAGTDIETVSAARRIATSCAKIVAQATKPKWSGFNSDPSSIRSSIIEKSKHGWVDFESLLAKCWEVGIPVIYLPDLPVEGRKMQGMVTNVVGRPVIVLSKKDQADWLLFILAHELGHIARGHLPQTEGGAIVDAEVTADSSSDSQEDEANSFALAVLTPFKGIRIASTVPKAPELAEAAIKFGKAKGISPGHVILNAVRNTTINGHKLFALGRAAQKLLPVELSSRPVDELCKESIAENIDVDRLTYDSAEYLENLGVL